MDNQLALTFVREHLRENHGIHLPDMMPAIQLRSGAAPVPFVGMSRNWIMMIVDNYDRINSETGPFVEIIVCTGDDYTPPEDREPIISVTCWERTGELKWDVFVSKYASKHFSHFRGHFLPHVHDFNFGIDLPHEEGVRWLDRLITDFRNYESS